VVDFKTTINRGFEVLVAMMMLLSAYYLEAIPGGLVIIMLAIGPKVCVFKPG
jgi:hypothetical protein